MKTHITLQPNSAAEVNRRNPPLQKNAADRRLRLLHFQGSMRWACLRTILSLSGLLLISSALLEAAQLGPATLCAGAARLDNGSVITLGQPFVGVMSAAGAGMTLNAGILPVLVPAISPPDGPILAPATALEGGRFHLSFAATPGHAFEVWASTNLVDWTVIWTGTAAGPTVQFEDADTVEYPWRFYRVRLP